MRHKVQRVMRESRLTCLLCVQDCSGDWRCVQQVKLVSVFLYMFRIQIPLRASTGAAKLQGWVIVVRVFRYVV